MKGERIYNNLGNVKDEYISEAAPVIKAGRSRSRIRWGIMAACICILILPVGVMAGRWFGLRDLFLSDPKNEYIGLSGYQGSPEMAALEEWNDFLAQYDIDNKIIEALGNEAFIVEGRENWILYGVYSYEMGEKLDEIVGKYGLKLHTNRDIIDQWELMHRVGGDFMEKECLTWAYIYEDGSFSVEGDVELSGCGMTAFQLGRAVKGTFDCAGLSVGQPENYTEWQYVTSCGEPVLLVLGPYKALIFADYESCFIAVNVLSGSENEMSSGDLQELADKIGFGILKDVRVPEMRGDSVAPVE